MTSLAKITLCFALSLMAGCNDFEIVQSDDVAGTEAVKRLKSNCTIGDFQEGPTLSGEFTIEQEPTAWFNLPRFDNIIVDAFDSSEFQPELSTITLKQVAEKITGSIELFGDSHSMSGYVQSEGDFCLTGEFTTEVANYETKGALYLWGKFNLEDPSSFQATIQIGLTIEDEELEYDQNARANIMIKGHQEGEAALSGLLLALEGDDSLTAVYVEKEIRFDQENEKLIATNHASDDRPESVKLDLKKRTLSFHHPLNDAEYDFSSCTVKINSAGKKKIGRVICDQEETTSKVHFTLVN